MFLHGSFLHIGFNMLFLFVFGPAIEYACGHLRFLAFYLLCGIAGGIAQIAIGPGSHVPALGASGRDRRRPGRLPRELSVRLDQHDRADRCFPLFLRLPAILVIGIWAADAVPHRIRHDQRPRGGVPRRDRVLRAHRRLLRGGSVDRPVGDPPGGEPGTQEARERDGSGSWARARSGRCSANGSRRTTKS